MDLQTKKNATAWEMILPCTGTLHLSSAIGDKELKEVPHGLHSARTKTLTRNLVGDEELKEVPRDF